MKFFKALIVILLFFTTILGLSVQASSDESNNSSNISTTTKEPSKIYVAQVEDAAIVNGYSKIDYANEQNLTLKILSKEKLGTQIDTSFLFPSPQFREPLKRGDKVLIGVAGDLTTNTDILIISKYRQNNLLVWSFLLLGLFILVAGFRNNIKYLQIFIISVISGIIVLALYHRNTYITFATLFAWQLVATILFAWRVFKSRTPALILALTVFANLLIVMGLTFVMESIHIFDSGLFDLFFSFTFPRKIMIYIFSILTIFPISIVFAEQLISESIRKKKEDPDILRIKLIQSVSKSSIRTLNNIFLTFFGVFYAIFIGVLAIASKENITFQVLNSASITQILSIGFLVLFDLIIFVPFVAFVTGIWFGKIETHEIITDRNIDRLDIE